MKSLPPLPSVGDADELLTGHLWIAEEILGLELRFQLRSSGLLRVGNSETVFDADAVPLPYRRAVREIRENLDRETLRAAVADVESVVFFGVVPVAGTVADNLESMPTFLGTEVWAADKEALRPPDAAHGIFQRLNLTPVNTFEREYPARDFDPESYTIPDSAWADSPAAGVVIKNKRGQRGRLINPAVERGVTEAKSTAPSAESLAETFVTERRVTEIQNTLEAADASVTVDAVTDRILETIGRQRPAVFLNETVAEGSVRSAVAQRVQPMVRA